MNITIENILKQAGRTIYQRGLRYFNQNRVTLTVIEEDHFEAVVKGDLTYDVRVQQVGEKLYASCTCPYWSMCKHVVAALLSAKKWYRDNRDPVQSEKLYPHWQDFFNQIYDEQETDEKKKTAQWRVIYVLNIDRESWSITPQKAYIKKNGELGRTSNIGQFDSESENLLHAPNDPIIISYLQRLEQQNASFYNYAYYSGYHYLDSQIFHFKYGSRLGPLFQFLADSALYFRSSKGVLDPVYYDKGVCEITLEFEDLENSYKLTPYVKIEDQKEPLDLKYRILTEKPIWLLYKNRIFKVENLANAGVLIPFTKEKIAVSIPKEEFPRFLEEAYNQITATTPLPMPDSVDVQLISNITEKRIYLKESFRQLQVYLRFAYKDHEIDYHDPRGQFFKKEKSGIVKIIRDRKQEEVAWQELRQTGLKTHAAGGFRIIESKALDWMFDNIPRLMDSGYRIFGQEKLDKYRVRIGSPNVRLAVTSNIDWFDLNLKIDIDGILLSLKELKKSIQHQQRYVKLADGSTARLSEEWVKKFRHLFHFTEVKEENIKVSRFHVTLIDMLSEDAISQQSDKIFQQSLSALQHFNGIKKQRIPKPIDGILRPYQEAGYSWLYFLQQYRFGGCLADDMGLGKTLQALTLLLKEKMRGNKTPSLIVCPTSVVFNWDKEVQKFTSGLKTLIHTGLDRAKSTSRFEKYDIVLTTYGVLRRDIGFLKDFQFHYAILDESQKIKNPGSQTAKAARLLNARYRLVLTGTPVENNTVELWSQFSFLNPGLLGSLHYFKKAFTLPIEKKGDEKTAQLLRQLIFPFILRRTKRSVAKELPPKVEQTLYCTMNPAQEKLYRFWRDYYRALILNKIDVDGLDSVRMNILEGLVKLRQIACHPVLIDKEIREDSGKYESLKEIVDEILAEDHKILVFSQFVRMLKLIRKYFDRHHIEYEYLDGNTVKREQCVDHFQNDERVRVFLISLKAGGTGLNLTAADYVIHYDPWWNPAVEVQATDRAHRIGQDKKVFVYRLITKDSVEEKILQLQQKKKKLVDNLISTDTRFFKYLTRSDIDILFS